MLIEPTEEKLQAMRLNSMLEELRRQQQDPQFSKLSFEERFGFVVDAEYLSRENRSLTRRLREAKLRYPAACMEAVQYSARRELDRAQMRQLASCRWIAEHLHVVITGATGVGKSWLACALAQQACRRGYRAVYRRVPRLFTELTLARADGTLPKVLAAFARIDLLVLDDMALAPLEERERLDLLEILEDRDGLRSTVVTSQFPPEAWHETIGDPTVADAILDRITHRAHRIDLKGPSKRGDTDTNGDTNGDSKDKGNKETKTKNRK